MSNYKGKGILLTTAIKPPIQIRSQVCHSVTLSPLISNKSCIPFRELVDVEVLARFLSRVIPRGFVNGNTCGIRTNEPVSSRKVGLRELRGGTASANGLEHTQKLSPEILKMNTSRHNYTPTVEEKKHLIIRTVPLPASPQHLGCIIQCS